MIRNFINDDIFVAIFTSSTSNEHKEKICTLIRQVSIIVANTVKIFLLEKTSR